MTSCPHPIPVQKNFTLSCLLSSSIQPGSPSYSPSDWLLYSLGDWFTRTAPGPSTSQSSYIKLYDQLSYSQGQGFEFPLSFKCKLKNVSHCAIQSPRQKEKKSLLVPSAPQKVFVFPKLILKNVHTVNNFISFVNLYFQKVHSAEIYLSSTTQAPSG